MLIRRSLRPVTFLLLGCVVITGACPPFSLAGTSHAVRSTSKDDEGRTQYDKGLEFLRRKEYEKAAQAFTNALSQGRRTAEVFYYRARACLLLKRYEEALADATKAIQLKADHAPAYLLRANANVHLDRLRDALEDLNRGLAITPNPILSQLYGARGMAYVGLKEPEKALKDLTKAIDLETTVPILYYHRGKILTSLGRYEEATRDFSAALNKAPDHEESLLDRGWVYGCLGDYQRSKSDLDRILLKNSDDLPARGLRGWIELELGEVETALADLHYAADHGSKDPWIHLNLASGLYRMGKVEEALRANERALSLKNDRIEAALHFQRGGFLLATERYAESRVAYEHGRVSVERSRDRIEVANSINDLRRLLQDHPHLKQVGGEIIAMLETVRDKIPTTARRDPALCQRPRSTGLNELGGS